MPSWSLLFRVGSHRLNEPEKLRCLSRPRCRPQFRVSRVESGWATPGPPKAARGHPQAFTEVLRRFASSLGRQPLSSWVRRCREQQNAPLSLSEPAIYVVARCPCDLTKRQGLAQNRGRGGIDAATIARRHKLPWPGNAAQAHRMCTTAAQSSGAAGSPGSTSGVATRPRRLPPLSSAGDSSARQTDKHDRLWPANGIRQRHRWSICVE